MSHERDFERQVSAASHDADTLAETPGRRSRSAALHAPATPIPSALVQRKGDGAVAPDADAALAATAGSAGSGLPSGLRAQFERSLGVDLSTVRVHTGGASETAAGAVGARAYAIGDDIHFGPGHYDPTSAAGQHLLAHEVAHTVQQRGGTRRVQHKLAVSHAGDASEHEADRAADAMVSGRAFALAGAPVAIARQEAKAPGDVELAPDEGTTPPSDAEREAARTYYTNLRGANLAAIQRVDAQLAAIPAEQPLQSSVVGPDVDAETRRQKRLQLEAIKTDLQAGNETIAGNLALLDDKNPTNQAKSVNRANSSKAVYTQSDPLNAVQLLLAGSGKSSHTKTVEQMSAHGVGTSTTHKTSEGVTLKDLTYEQSESESVTTSEGGKRKTVADGSKVTVGASGASATTDHTVIEDGKMTKSSSTSAVTLKEGRGGVQKTISKTEGTESDGELVAGTSTSTTAGGGVAVAHDAITADAGAGAARTTQDSTVDKTTVTTMVNGSARLSIQKDSKGNYTATITLTLSGAIGASTTKGHESGEKASATATASGELRKSQTRTFTVSLTEAEVEAYKQDFQSAANGSATSKPGLHYVYVLKTKGEAGLLAELGEGSEGARKTGLGYEQTDTTGYSVGGGAGVTSNPTSPGATGVGVALKVGEDERVRFGHSPKPGDPSTLIVVIEVAVDRTITAGPTVSSGPASGGVGYVDKKGSGTVFKFEMANDPALVAQLSKIKSVDDAQQFVRANSKQLLEQGDRVGTGDGIATTVGAGGVNASLTRGGSHGVTEVKDGNGNLVRTEIYGRNEVEGGANAGPVSLGSRKDVDEIYGSVNADGTADLNLDTSSTTKTPSATELGKNLSDKPIVTTYQLLTGSPTPYLATSTDTSVATKLNEKDLELIQKAAEDDDDSKWAKAVGGDGKALDDWYATRQKIRDANGDKAKIAAALAEFEDSWDAGRGETVRGLGVGRYHAAWPPEIAGERAAFEKVANPKVTALVVATYRSDGLEAAQKHARELRAEIQRLLGVLGNHTDKFKDAAMLGEMNKVLGKRSSELHWLENDLPNQARKEHNANRTALIEQQKAHGVDTVNGQTIHTHEALRPEECLDDSVKYQDPGAEQTALVLSPEEEAKQKRDAAMAEIKPHLQICRTNKITEQKALLRVKKELSGDNGKPDYTKVFPELNSVKAMWPGWEDSLKRMRDAAHSVGGDTSSIDKLGPDKTQWNELNDKATSAAG